MSKTLEFIYDIGSVPCYFAWRRLPDLVRETGASLVRTPVLAGAIFKALDNPGPTAVPVKANWYLEDLRLWAAHHGIPYKTNSHAPFTTLPLMRGVLVAEERGELDAYMDALFKPMWLEQKNVDDREVVRAALADAGLDPEPYFTEITRQDIKDRLRANTDAAMARGVFGVPTFFVADKLFFGQDRLHFVRDALRAGD